MKVFKKISLLFFLCCLCFSCSQRAVRIVSNHGSVYSRHSSYNKDKYRHLNKRRSTKSQQIEVVSGDTLYGIAKTYQIPLRDLIRVNDLEPPYRLRAGRFLTVPAPSFHKVRSGETLKQIARRYKMNADNIVALNDLEAPYRLKKGQELVISKNITPKKTKKKEERQRVASHSGPRATPRKKNSNTFVERNLNKTNAFAWPLQGTVISKFGPKSEGLYNDGINIRADQGTEVKASESGTVAYVGNELKGYGNLVIIKHSGGWITAYAHLLKTMVKKGQKVGKQDVIAQVGATGNVSSPQLYFGLRKGRDAVNPANYLK